MLATAKPAPESSTATLESKRKVVKNVSTRSKSGGGTGTTGGTNVSNEFSKDSRKVSSKCTSIESSGISSAGVVAERRRRKAAPDPAKKYDYAFPPESEDSTEANRRANLIRDWRATNGDLRSVPCNVPTTILPMRQQIGSQSDSKRGSKSTSAGSFSHERSPTESELCWQYLDPRGAVQGPFAPNVMRFWILQGKIPDWQNLMVRYAPTSPWTEINRLYDVDNIESLFVGRPQITEFSSISGSKNQDASLSDVPTILPTTSLMDMLKVNPKSANQQN